MISGFLVLVFLAIFATTLVVGVSVEHWPFLYGFTQTDLHFGDLGVLLVMADFLRESPGGNPYIDFPLSGYTPNYPLMIPAWLARLNFGFADVLPLGIASAILLGVSFAALLACALQKQDNLRKLTNFLIFSLFAFSPPSMLLLERGNYDIWVFVLVVAGALMFGSSRLFAITAVGTAGFIKFFPIAALSVFIRLRGWTAGALAIGLLFVGYLVSIRDQVASVSANTPRPTWAAFGALVLPSYLDVYVTTSALWQFFMVLGVHAAGIAIAIAVIRSRKDQLDDLVLEMSVSGSRQGLFSIGVTVFIAAYMLGNSFDYRLIFLLLPITALLMGRSQSNEIKNVLIAGTIFVFFWSFPANGISPFADFVIIPVLSIYGYIVGKIIGVDIPLKRLFSGRNRSLQNREG